MRKFLILTTALTAFVSGEALSATSSTTTTWTTVASEYQNFSLTSSKTVRFGAGSSWVQKTLSGTNNCEVATFGSDPAYGVAKSCQVSSTTTSTSSTSTSTTSTSTWSTVANEYQSFALSSSKTVRFGAGSSWVQKTLSGTNNCEVATFGTDPAYGVAKVCQTSSTTSATTSSTPTSTTSTSTWSTVANEYQNFSLSSSKTVRFGSGSSWVQKTLSGANNCEVATFGTDPAYGVAKVCQVSSTTSTASSGTTSGSTTTSGTTTSSGTTTTSSGTTSSGTTTASTGGTTTTSGSTTTGSTSTSGSTTTVITKPASYSASLAWTIPTTRANGTPLALSDLTGYEVYYTNDSGTVTVSIPVSGGSTVTTVVSNLPSGSYHFSISAIDTSGLKSALSTVASLTFP